MEIGALSKLAGTVDPEGCSASPFRRQGVQKKSSNLYSQEGTHSNVH